MKLRTGFLTIAASTMLAVATAADAQLAGGLRAPTSKLDGAVGAQTFACFLSSAGRPVPGVNLDAPELMGEGLKVQTAADPWLTEAVEIAPASNLATLDTPEGPIWIVFDPATRACTLALQTSDAAGFRTAFIADAFEGDWKRKKDRSAHGFRYERRLAGLKFVSTFPDLPTGSQVFAVQTRTN
jgi:hypothetical protein